MADETRWLVRCCNGCGCAVWLGRKPRRKHKHSIGCYGGKGRVEYLDSAQMAVLFPKRLHPMCGDPPVLVEFK